MCSLTLNTHIDRCVHSLYNTHIGRCVHSLYNTRIGRCVHSLYKTHIGRCVHSLYNTRIGRCVQSQSILSLAILSIIFCVDNWWDLKKQIKSTLSMHTQFGSLYGAPISCMFRANIPTYHKRTHPVSPQPNMAVFMLGPKYLYEKSDILTWRGWGWTW